MRMINIITIMLWITGMLFGVHSAVAGDRFKIYEMGESGQAVIFPMSAEEIAAENAAAHKRAVLKDAVNAEPEERRIRFEMGESGQRASFPMSAEEIAAADAEKASRMALKETRRNLSEERVVTFEMGESGQVVIFPMSAEEIAAEDAAGEKLAATGEGNIEARN